MTKKHHCPRRPFASLNYVNHIERDEHAGLPRGKLPDTVPIIGLGCSSFSKFFDQQVAIDHTSKCDDLTADMIPPPKHHPTVKEWVKTIQYAVLECGINLLDTSPWYGHGMSECVVGYAMDTILISNDIPAMNSSQEETLLAGKNRIKRSEIIINTKIGRYSSEPKEMFDFSSERVRQSTLQSISRMRCEYIDVLQLHDPEFSPSFELLINETIPEMARLRDEDGLVKAIGMTGYPLEVQAYLIDAAYKRHGILFDTSLVYCHYNLHDQSLFKKALKVPSSSLIELVPYDDTFNSDNYTSYANFLESMDTKLLAAAPLSMGLLTSDGPPSWHPASNELKIACRHVEHICAEHNVNFAALAMLFALNNDRVACTVIGMKDRIQVDKAMEIASRYIPRNTTVEEESGYIKDFRSSSAVQSCQSMFFPDELKVIDIVNGSKDGPFSDLIKQNMNEWNGLTEARKFWSNIPISHQFAGSLTKID